MLGYVIGAIPFGILIGRAAGGVDLRQHGSGRIGATNALRTVGLPAAVVVFVLDIGKGVAAVLAVRWLYQAGPAGSPDWVAAGAGLAAVVGHVRSIFIGFSGGRGVATFTGGMLALAPLVVAILAPVFAVIVWRWRFVSLGSVSVALLAPLLTAVLAFAGQSSVAVVAFAVASAAVVVGAHADNIARLRAGSERRIGQ
ncbi:MAG TPA: glycerol-3-phosphate 1-O-acyltransferase PlsY [Candidatus Saccharimonadales bacterium]|nr:glycerol-3-phosphate 1-O-acyltransferase PlsY [Candidatus Saccharimonadales bacterium]